jgi:1-acyl-sn-glycerol-3-phosphate acyltransferase
MKKFKDTLVSVLLYMSGGTCFGLGATFLLLLSFFHTGPLFEWLTKRVCKAVIFCSGIRVKLEGTENFDPKKQYIVMMNHVNFFDGLLFYSKYPGKARALEEESHFKWIIYGWLIRRVGFIPVNRKSGRKALTALKRAGELIRKRKNFSLALMPEGTRTRTGKLGEFKKGGFLIALEAGLDILPMLQVGSFEVKRKGHWLIRPGKVRLVIDKPIPTGAYTRDNITELMEKTRKVFLEYVE